MMLRILLLGGTDLSLAIARGLIEAGFDLVGVVHLGRSIPISYDKSGIQNYRFSDIGGWCKSQSVANQMFKDNAGIEVFARNVNANFLLVAGWYHLVPERIRSLFKHGAAGLHASLLPKLRGGAPLPWAILSGADKTGVSMFALSDDIDAGELYGQAEIAIGPRTSVTKLVAAVQALSIRLVTDCLRSVSDGTMKLRKQSGTPTYCLQRTPDDGRIDWRQSASEIDRLVRAVCRPYPGAFTDFDGQRVTIWKSDIAPDTLVLIGRPGQIARVPDLTDPVVVTGRGSLIVREAEADGANAMPRLRKSGNMRFCVA
jgi:methionyl-tRNA formyltransferase